MPVLLKPPLLHPVPERLQDPGGHGPVQHAVVKGQGHVQNRRDLHPPAGSHRLFLDAAAAEHQAGIRADVDKFTNANLIAQRDRVVGIANS